jgi:carboxypeptidase C (cathepsin A)
MSDEEAKEKPDKPPAPPEERESVTEHSVELEGGALSYRATAGTVVLRTEEGEPRASVFFVAYTRTDPDPQRPLTFAFNGGPGSSSAWLHLGLLGPRRVEVPDGPAPPTGPYRLLDNPDSLIEASDLVFVDPVSTGYSRAATGQEAKQFHGFREDLESVGDFIRLYTTRAGRWASPKFVVGESYGTVRAAALAHHLQERHGMYLNGVGLISSVLMFQSVRPELGNDLPHVLILPSYAATAWYHGRLDPCFDDLRRLTDEVEEFALGDYASLLLRGSRAGAAARSAALERLATYTGLEPSFLEQCDLRVAPSRFFKELLRSERRTVGRLDSRFKGIDADAAGEEPEYDPSYSIVQAAFAPAVNAYLRAELGFESDDLYEVLNGERVRPWNYGEEGSNRFLDVASMLRQAMSRNRGLQVLLASGYFDLATPFAAAEWTLDHMGLDPSLTDRVREVRYEAGHMMYLHPPSRRELGEELRQLVRRAVRAPS